MILGTGIGIWVEINSSDHKTTTEEVVDVIKNAFVHEYSKQQQQQRSSSNDPKTTAAAAVTGSVATVIPPPFFKSKIGDCALGGCMFTAADLDSSKNYLQQSDGSWLVAYLVCIYIYVYK